MNIFWLLFSFNGRLNRAKYWLGWGLVCVFVAAETALGSLLPKSAAVSFIFGVGALCALVSLFAIIVKRLHDLSLSGWWTQAPIAIVFVPLVLVSSFSNDARYTLSIGMIYVALAYISLMWLGYLKGVTGPNRYGPDPLGDAVVSEGSRA